jgi:hypothetical protein
MMNILRQALQMLVFVGLPGKDEHASGLKQRMVRCGMRRTKKFWGSTAFVAVSIKTDLLRRVGKGRFLRPETWP